MSLPGNAPTFSSPVTIGKQKIHHLPTKQMVDYCYLTMILIVSRIGKIGNCFGADVYRPLFGFFVAFGKQLL